MKLTFLGTGTSHGVPVIGCECKVCKSSDLKDRRYRSSVYITTNENKHILIDIGPEFRLQALENNIKNIDSVLLTHGHADHLHGIDDLRIFSCVLSKRPENASAEKYDAPPIPIYTNASTIKDIEVRFAYFFKSVTEGGGHAKVVLTEAKDSFECNGITITPIPMMHGSLATTGWLLSQKETDGSINSIAYLTDCSFISDESIELIKNKCGTLKHLVIDGLREKEHSTHFNFLQAMEVAEKIGGEKVWLTHLTHMHSHQDVAEYISQNLAKFPGLKKCKSVLPAYDKLVLEC